jgi:hypothetical protein
MRVNEVKWAYMIGIGYLLNIYYHKLLKIIFIILNEKE